MKSTHVVALVLVISALPGQSHASSSLQSLGVSNASITESQLEGCCPGGLATDDTGCLTCDSVGDTDREDGVTFDVVTGATGIYINNFHLRVNDWPGAKQVRVYVTTDGLSQHNHLGSFSGWTEIYKENLKNDVGDDILFDIGASLNHYVPPGSEQGVFITFRSHAKVITVEGSTYQETIDQDSLIEVRAGKAVEWPNWKTVTSKRNFEGRVCYTEATTPVDPICQGDNFYGGADLPQYWQDIADDQGVDKTMIGFNADEGVWCYDGQVTCIAWGEWDEECDTSTFACAGTYQTPVSKGCGISQIKWIKDMVANGDDVHHLCPVCAESNLPHGKVRRCVDGTAQEVPGSHANPPGVDPGTHEETIAQWTACNCEEHFTGIPVVEDGYWWDEAELAGLSPGALSQLDGRWYYNENPTCVGFGYANGNCDAIWLYCAGAGNNFGFAQEQMAAVLAAVSHTGVHPQCPMP